MAFEQYLQRGKQKLRCGYTTGCCAALAAKAAARMLLTQRPVAEASLLSPKGIPVSAPVEEAAYDTQGACCAIRKDAGDDCDVTHGLLIYAKVAPSLQNGVAIDGGLGVGRVTRPGLDQPVGAAAINTTPRRMIREEVEAVCRELGYSGGLSVVISAPGGEAIAQKTFNPMLGIQGGISILGTSGIVEPQSLQALVDTIQVELKMHAAAGRRAVIFTPGNYGEDFLKTHPPAEDLPVVKISNFLGDSLDFAAELGFETVYLVGHIGKFSKLAAGVMNTHSRYADGRCEVFAAHAGMAGANRETIRLLMEAPTADQCLAILEQAGIKGPVLATMLEKILFHTRRRADGVQVEAVLFSNQSGPLAYSGEAGRFFNLTKEGARP